MKTAFGEYRRLAKSALGFSSLWLGEDHLLYVRGSGFLLPFSEEYKRFRYRDIQSVTIAETSGLVWGAIGYLAGLLVVAGIGFAFLFNRPPDDIALLVITLLGPLPLCVLFLALLIRHLALGPRCLFELRTALKREPINAINRLGRGRETLAILGEKIRRAQEDLVPDEGDRAASSATPRPTAKPPGLEIPKPTLLAFGSQVALGVAIILLLHLSGMVLAGLALVIAIFSGTPLLMSFAGSLRHPTPDSVRKLLWAQLVAEILLGTTASVFYVDQAINDPSLTVNVLGPLRAFADISALGGFVFYLLFLLVALAQIGIGISGIIRTRQWQETLTRPASPA
ncbi:MAG: hypothetical protein KDN19_11000 [Verrucomicrobiae bacterium]|nr:hypothetical protein [Verrucomicrobiae bacterium]